MALIISFVNENQQSDTNVAKNTALKNLSQYSTFSPPTGAPQRSLVRFLQIFIEYSGISAPKPRYFAPQTAVSHQIQFKK